MDFYDPLSLPAQDLETLSGGQGETGREMLQHQHWLLTYVLCNPRALFLSCYNIEDVILLHQF